MGATIGIECPDLTWRCRAAIWWYGWHDFRHLQNASICRDANR
jgi:hypothetical protein